MDQSRSRVSSPRRRPRVLLGVVALVAVVVAGLLLWPSASTPTAVASPSAYTVTWWTNALGGDTAIGTSQIAQLNDQTQSGLAASEDVELVSLGRRGAIADLSGVGRASFGDYFSENSAGLCSMARVLSVSPVVLPVATTAGVNTTNWAKILVLYDASCAGSPVGANSPQVLFLYARLVRTWHLTHEYQIPGSQDADPATNDSPASWQMTTFSSCTGAQGTTQRDVIVVVKAFDLMCEAAANDGVNLAVTAGWRSATQQAALFSQAVKEYGSVAKAKQFVSYAKGNDCTSLHCAGVAVDVEPSKSALAWLYKVVGCLANGKVTLGASSCASGQEVLQMERYGFSAPAAQIPEYLVYVLPTTSSTQNCNPSVSTPVAVQVAQIWRCVLAENGFSAGASKPVVAAAEVVSLCESGWNSDAVAFGGKYTKTPDPATKTIITNSGVFMLSDAEMARYGALGSSGLSSVANINAAANLWLASSSFEAFGCATGHGVFDAGPVLPQYGGPPVPGWAYDY